MSVFVALLKGNLMKSTSARKILSFTSLTFIVLGNTELPGSPVKLVCYRKAAVTEATFN
jgi:hypothetical protein